MSERALFIVIMAVLGLTGYMFATRPPLTAQDREEMEEDWWS
jgi:hypothetical protein